MLHDVVVAFVVFFFAFVCVCVSLCVCLCVCFDGFVVCGGVVILR